MFSGRAKIMNGMQMWPDGVVRLENKCQSLYLDSFFSFLFCLFMNVAHYQVLYIQFFLQPVYEETRINEISSVFEALVGESAVE